MRDDLDPGEPDFRAELRSLSREREPGRLLEARTVRSLRAQGLLRVTRMPTSWRVAAAAAAVALFAGGFAVGQSAATRAVRTAVMAERDLTALEAARAVQRTGSAYVMALATLASLGDSTTDGALEQGREAARAALYAAAVELASLEPDDPIAVQLRRYLAGTAARGAAEQSETRNVVWF